MTSSKTALLSVLSNTFIVISKLFVGVITGSVAVLSEAIHSSLDLVASLIAFFSVRMSGRSADENHPYGHGKIENISGTIETLLIFVAGIWIIYECVQKIINPTPINFPHLGILVMFVGAIINYLVSRKVGKAAEENHSVAMKSNALHLLTDVYTSLGVGFSLLLVSITGWELLDPIIGIMLAMYIMREAYKLMRESFPPLLDASLTDEEMDQILNVIHQYREQFIEIHDFRTRRSGPQEYVDFHMVVPSSMNIEKAHRLCDDIEHSITALFKRAQVLIHVEPEQERTTK